MSSENDHTVTILRRKQTKAEAVKSGNVESVKKFTTGNKQTTAVVSDARKLENDDDYKLPTVTAELKKQLQAARNAFINPDGSKGMKQSELASKCKVSEKVIKDLENGVGLVNQTHLNAINKVLGTKLKKPKQVKKKSTGAEDS